MGPFFGMPLTFRLRARRGCIEFLPMSVSAPPPGGPRVPVAVFGAAGYSGALLCRLLRRHPALRLAAVAADRQAEAATLAEVAAWPAGEREQAVALLATPAESSSHLAPLLLRQGLRVLDLSGAFRLADPELAAATYGLVYEGEAGAILRGACYSLPELPALARPAAPATARLLANPGCYVTAALLSLAPLCRRGLLAEGAPLFVDGKSGASGAGRKAAIELSLCELEGEVRPYRLGGHQHTPEIAQGLARLLPAGVAGPRLRFVPHIVGTRRGLLVTCHGQLRPGATAAAVQAAYREDYGAAADHRGPAVHLLPPSEVTLRRPVGGPDACVGVHVDPDGTFCALGSLDNLMKGAASQAVQNLNLMLGLAPQVGLEDLFS